MYTFVLTLQDYFLCSFIVFSHWRESFHATLVYLGRVNRSEIYPTNCRIIAVEVMNGFIAACTVISLSSCVVFKLAKCLHHTRKLHNQLPHRWIKNAGLQSASINPAFTNTTVKKIMSEIFTNCYSHLKKARVKHYEAFISMQEMSGIFSAAQLRRTVHDTVYNCLWTQLGKKLEDDTWCDVQSTTNHLLTKRCANSTVWITILVPVNQGEYKQ